MTEVFDKLKALQDVLAEKYSLEAKNTIFELKKDIESLDEKIKPILDFLCISMHE